MTDFCFSTDDAKRPDERSKKNETILISFDCVALDGCNSCVVGDVANIFFCLILYSLLLQTFQVLINGIIRVFLPNHLVLIIVHNDSRNRITSSECFHLMFIFHSISLFPLVWLLCLCHFCSRFQIKCTYGYTTESYCSGSDNNPYV